MASNALRTLKIKTGVVERTLKELKSYEKELEQNKKKIAELRASSDQSMLKQWENVLGETQGMIPDTNTRLSNAVEDLTMVVENAQPEDGYDGTGELEKAKAVLSAASEALNA